MYNPCSAPQKAAAQARNAAPRMQTAPFSGRSTTAAPAQSLAISKEARMQQVVPDQEAEILLESPGRCSSSPINAMDGDI